MSCVGTTYDILCTAFNSYLSVRWQSTEAGSTQGSAVGTGEEARAEGDAGGVGRGSHLGLSRGVG